MTHLHHAKAVQTALHNLEHALEEYLDYAVAQGEDENAKDISHAIRKTEVLHADLDREMRRAAGEKRIPGDVAPAMGGPK